MLTANQHIDLAGLAAAPADELTPEQMPILVHQLAELVEDLLRRFLSASGGVGRGPCFVRMLTPEQVADRLQLDVDTVKRGKLRTELPWMTLGGELRMHPEALEQHLRILGGVVNGDLLGQGVSQVPVRLHAPTTPVHGAGIRDERRSPRRRTRAPASSETRPYRPIPDVSGDGGSVP
jgi:hypothetical protein